MRSVPCGISSMCSTRAGATRSSMRRSAKASPRWRRCGGLVGRESCAGRRGVGRLRRLLEQRSPDYQPSASEFQAVVRRLLIAAGLAFVEEYVITASDGSFVCRADFKLVDAPV